MNATVRLSYDKEEYRKRLHRARVLQETNLLCCGWSPCGSQVLAGSNFGDLAAWNAAEVLRPADLADSEAFKGLRRPPRGPIVTRRVSQSPLYDLRFLGDGRTLLVVTEEELVVLGAGFGGENGRERGDLMDLEGQAEPLLREKLRIPAQFFSAQRQRRAVMRPEFNCAAKGTADAAAAVVVGCGDGSLRTFDVQAEGRLVDTRHGHQRAIQSVCQVGSEPHSFVSASEDGSFGLWDLRLKEAVVRTTRIDSSGNSNAWAAACAVDGDGAWALVGGGRGDGIGSGYGVGGYLSRSSDVRLSGHASVIHLGSGRILETVPRATPVHAVAATQAGWILGGEQNVQTMPPVNLTAAVGGEAKTTSPAIFAMGVAPGLGADAPLVVCGASPYVDLYAYAGHRSAVLGL
mmetsp:Transcript_1139/g.4814  ORF Transcript_1139/g.4814 Transcript_1139/m.4814 type:complete len:404 (+) Transcript_1139:14-1225(+)